MPPGCWTVDLRPKAEILAAYRRGEAGAGRLAKAVKAVVAWEAPAIGALKSGDGQQARAEVRQTYDRRSRVLLTRGAGAGAVGRQWLPMFPREASQFARRLRRRLALNDRTPGKPGVVAFFGFETIGRSAASPGPRG